MSDSFSETKWFSIPYLPDVLNNHLLLHETKQGRLLEYLKRWTGVIAALASSDESVTYCLRFIGRARTERVSAYLGFKIHDRTKSGESDAAVSAATEALVVGLFKNCGIQLAPLSRKDVDSFPQLVHEDRVLHITQNFNRPVWEDPKTDNEQTAYDRRWVMRPFREPMGDFSSFFAFLHHATRAQSNLLLESGSFAAVSTYFRPTTITKDEKKWIWGQMRLSRQMAQESLFEQNERSGVSVEQTRQRVSETYHEYLMSLENACVCHADVVVRSSAEDKTKIIGETLADLLCSQIDQSQIDLHSDKPTDVLIGRAHVTTTTDVERIDQGEIRKLAIEPFNDLSIRRWAGLSAEMDEVALRIPYLMSPGGVSTIFRLPIDMGGGIPGMPVRQAPPDFDPGNLFSDQGLSNDANHIGQIFLGELESSGRLNFKENDLTRHALIVGNTGSGKTTTCKHLLSKLSVNFLVLETAKKEYRELLQIDDDLQVFTPGSEGVVPLRLNPFELLPGVRVESHIGALQTCFEASMPIGGPLFSILEEALASVYSQLGWRLDESRPERTGKIRPFPTMSLFAATLKEIAESRGYAGEVQSNVSAAIAGRISPLTIRSGTSKGRMLDCFESYPPIADLFEKSTVIELNDLRAEDKSFVTMLLLVFLREYRESRQNRFPEESGLQHVTLIEEAHNVLNATPSSGGEDSPDTRNAAIERFANMLTEMRSLNEGLVIADQSPHKILPDALRNTNLQIVHQLRASDDRKAVSESMVMSEQQEDFLAKLHIGKAAVYYTSLERATFVTIPETPDENKTQAISDEQLRETMGDRLANNGLLRKNGNSWPFRLCFNCSVKDSCSAKDSATRIAKESPTALPQVRKLFREQAESGSLENSVTPLMKLIQKLTFDGEKRPTRDEFRGVFWCVLAHALESSDEGNNDKPQKQVELQKIRLNNFGQIHK